MPETVKARRSARAEQGSARFSPTFHLLGCRMVSLRERCAFHEAGHAVAAITFGIPIIAVTIAADTPHLHRAHYRAPHDCGKQDVQPGYPIKYQIEQLARARVDPMRVFKYHQYRPAARRASS
jgi:hypothetical protein